MKIKINQIKSQSPPKLIKVKIPSEEEGISKWYQKELAIFWCPQCSIQKEIEILLREVHRGSLRSHMSNDPNSYLIMQFLVKHRGKEIRWKTIENRLGDKIFEYLRFGYIELIFEGFRPRLKTWRRQFIRVNIKKTQAWIDQYTEFRREEIRSLLMKFKSKDDEEGYVSKSIEDQLAQIVDINETVIRRLNGDVFTKLDISNRGYDEFLGLILLVAQQIDKSSYITVDELSKKYREEIGSNFSYQLSKLRELLGPDLTPFFILERQPLRLSPVDIRKTPLKTLRVGLFPLWTKREDYEDDARYKEKSRIDIRNKIIDVINEASRKELDFIVLPELALPWPDQELFNIASNLGVGLIGGLEYHQKEGLRNRSIIQFADGTQFFQDKQFRSKYDLEDMVGGNSVKLFHGTPWGDFAVLICFDLTDIGLLAELRGKVDFIVVPTFNPSVDTFENIQKAISYLDYCFIIIVNSAEYGKTQIVGPLKGKENRIPDFREIQQEELLITELPRYELQQARQGKSKAFQGEPAGFPWKKTSRKIVGT